LRAIGAVFRAGTGFDGTEGADLHFIGIKEDAMNTLCLEHQIAEWKLKQGRNFSAGPVMADLGSKAGIHRVFRILDDNTWHLSQVNKAVNQNNQKRFTTFAAFDSAVIQSHNSHRTKQGSVFYAHYCLTDICIAPATKASVLFQLAQPLLTT
jgi:hypothetical protein